MTCRHGVNHKHCRACRKQAGEFVAKLEALAKMGIQSAATLLSDIDTGVHIEDLKARLDAVADEYEEVNLIKE